MKLDEFDLLFYVFLRCRLYHSVVDLALGLWNSKSIIIVCIREHLQAPLVCFCQDILGILRLNQDWLNKTGNFSKGFSIIDLVYISYPNY